MIKRIFTFAAILLFTAAFANAQDFRGAYKLYKDMDYFGLRDAIPQTKYAEKWQKKYLQALSDGVFSGFRNSNTLISELLKDSSLPDSLKAELYKTKAVNCVNLGEYRDALECDRLLSAKYMNFLDADEKEDIVDDTNLWEAVADAPRQTTSKTGEVKIQMKRDIAQLWNIPVSINGTDYDFIFDTGANFSVIVESEAVKLGLKLTDTKLMVGTATGKKVESKVAICPELKIKDVTVKNAVFLVVPDKALSFGFYKIIGIIGNPVIRSFEEITVNSDNLLTIPATPTKSAVQNLAFHGFTPVIQMLLGTDTLRFTFDSGAMATMLYRPYFEKYRKDIEGKLELVDIRIGGAGGMEKIKGYYIPEVRLSVNGMTGTISNVSLLSEFSKNKDKYFHGNLGQDYFSNFKEMTFNFTDMFVNFK